MIGVRSSAPADSDPVLQTVDSEKNTGKPSDDGEGVPGYLVDPDAIQVRNKSDGLEFSAPAGSVRAIGGAPQQVVIRIGQMDLNTLTIESGDAAVAGYVKATGVTTGKVAADGSFNSLYTGKVGQPVVISFLPYTILEAITVSKPPLKGASVVYSKQVLTQPFRDMASDVKSGVLDKQSSLQMPTPTCFDSVGRYLDLVKSLHEEKGYCLDDSDCIVLHTLTLTGCDYQYARSIHFESPTTTEQLQDLTTEVQINCPERPMECREEGRAVVRNYPMDRCNINTHTCGDF